MLKITLVCAVIFVALNVTASANFTTATPTNFSTSVNPITRLECECETRCVDCEIKCCGKFNRCARNCIGALCNNSSQCGGGCCSDSGNCTERCSEPTTKPSPKPRCFGCDFRCCGKYYACAKNCSGYPCDEDSQCGGGCCSSSGNCTESCSKPFELTPIQVGLVAGGSALVLSLSLTCTCKCVSDRRKRKKEPTNVIVNMHGMPMQGNPNLNQPQQGNSGVNYGYQTGRGNR